MRPNSKTMQKKLAAYARMKAEAANSKTVAEIDVVVPTTLRSGQPGSGMWDVYFNGERQHLCTFADNVTGRITRHVHGRGNIGIGKETETLYGTVDFVRKGQPYTYQRPPAPTPTPAPIAAPVARQRVAHVGPRGVLGLAAFACLLGAGVQFDEDR